jgi:hypothetical protein
MLLRASPKSLNFGEILKGKSKTMTFKLIPSAGTKFEIEKMVPPTAGYAVREVRTLAVANIWRTVVTSSRNRLVKQFGSTSARAELLEREKRTKPKEQDEDVEGSRTISVTLLPTASTGKHSGRIEIHTNLEKKKLLGIPVWGKVVGHIMVEPQAHNFGVIKRGETREAAFKITSRKKTMFNIRRVEKTYEHVATELSEVQPGVVYELKVKIPPDIPVGRLHGTVKLYTSDPAQPEIEIAFFGKVID